MIMDTKIRAINFEDLIEQVEPSDSAYDPQIAFLTRELLQALGEDPEREGLQRTPERVARMYEELLAGYQTDLVALVNGAIFESDYQNLVVVRDIEFHSMCEHHMLPFLGKAHVAYIPDGKIIGLSKIPRLVEMFARRLQVQERMTDQIAATVQEILQARGVAVVVEGIHMCAVVRGVKKTAASMVTSAFLGDFKTNEKLRDEFLAHLRRGEDRLL
jgi:GTP cyclohydrolase I